MVEKLGKIKNKALNEEYASEMYYENASSIDGIELVNNLVFYYIISCSIEEKEGMGMRHVELSNMFLTYANNDSCSACIGLK